MEAGISNFWKNLQELTAGLPLDGTRPAVERYAFQKVPAHRCAFCVPLRGCGTGAPYPLDSDLRIWYIYRIKSEIYHK